MWAGLPLVAFLKGQGQVELMHGFSAKQLWHLCLTALFCVAPLCIPMTSKAAAVNHCTVLSDLSRESAWCVHACVCMCPVACMHATDFPLLCHLLVLSLGGKRSWRGQDAHLTSQWTRVWSVSSFGWACQISTIRMIGTHAASEPCIVMYERHADNFGWNISVWWEEYVSHVMIVI